MPNALPTRMPLIPRRPCLLAWILLALSPATTLADDGEIEYQSAPARVTANVEHWGEDCGVRPKSYTLNERPHVGVSRRGEHVTLRFPSGTVYSDQCWSKNPALKRISTSARPGSWKTRCETPQGDPKSETGVYEIVARDDTTLELTESSRYDWQLKTSHCIATVRTVRTLTRTSPADQGPEPIQAAEPVEASEPPQAEAGCVPGSLASVQVVPARARIEPGATLCFSARGKDADGCPIEDPPVRWSVKALDHGQGRMHGHCFRSAASAAEGEGRFRVAASAGKLNARALVHVVTPDLSDITLRAVPGASGGALPPSAQAGAAGEDGRQSETRVAARAVHDTTDGGLLAALAALAVVLGGAATWLALRKRGASPGVALVDPAPATADREATPPPPARTSSAAGAETPSLEAAAGEPPAASVARSRPTEPMICPQCRRGYAPGAERCESDGTALITYKAFTAQASGSEATCTSCGATLEAGSTFCGRCGTRLSS